jgi:ATP-dependent Clp protease protease subunit
MKTSLFNQRNVTKNLLISLLWITLGVNAQPSEELTKPVKPVPQVVQEQATLKANNKPVPLTAQPLAKTLVATTSLSSTQPKEKDSATPPPPVVVYDDETKKLAQEVKKLQLEQSKLTLEYEKALSELQQEKDKLLLENELQTAKEEQLLAELNATKARLEVENDIYEHKQKQILAYLNSEKEKLVLQNVIQEEKNKQQKLQLELATAKLDYESLKLNFEKEQIEAKVVKRSKSEEWESQVNKPKEYQKEPFVKGKLMISDRKIILDGPIWPGMASYIIERIEYFNNKTSEYPIFLIIEYCPGGSVMEGSRILKAMKSSRAPVYVVLRSLAASMAAAIVTLAERSYALPDAIMVHHQVWGISWGNQTEQREQLKVLEEWSQRIMQPIAAKMGLTLEELVKKMYENNSRGDWSEFASQAVKYHWVDHIIEDIHDTSYTKQPTEKEEPKEDPEEITIVARQEQIDSEGNRYMKVPHLRPLDVYHLYNPDNYYRY